MKKENTTKTEHKGYTGTHKTFLFYWLQESLLNLIC